MKIHIVSETMYMMKGNGVHTAFIDHVELLKSKDDIKIVINNEGYGDVFHCHTYGLYYFWKGIGYKNRRVLTVHVIPDSIKGSLPMWPVFMPFVKWYFKQVYSYADVCIAISPEVEKAIKELGVKTEIVRIFNPVNTEKWLRTPGKRELGRKMLGLGNDEFVVLGVGQLQGRKGVEDFIDVASSIPQARFIWAGGRPFKALTEGISRIDGRIETAPSNIQFTGMLELDQMPLIYAAADVLLFTSYQENCPLAPIEAASCGMPVVFRDINEYKSLYKTDYLKAKDTNAFIEITQQLMLNTSFYKEGLEISKNIVMQFDKDKIRNELVNLYKNLETLQNLRPSWI